MSKRARLSLGDEERRKGPPPAHGFDGPPERTSKRATTQAADKNADQAQQRRQASAEPAPRPAGGRWTAHWPGARRRAGKHVSERGPARPTSAAEGAQAASVTPWLRRPAVRILLASAVTAASLIILKRRFF
jgi:hypothetical protein